MRIICSNEDCQATNWVELGDLNDYSARDRHAATCHECQTKFWIDWKIKKYAEDHFDFDHMDITKDVIDQDEVYCIEGVAKP